MNKQVMNAVYLFTVSGPLLGWIGWFLDLPWLFWVGIGVCSVTLFLNLASGVLKLPIIPGALMVGGAVYFEPWYHGIGLGLLAWTSLEAIGDVIGQKRRQLSVNTDREAPPIYGGDATGKDEPAIVNCASMGLANQLIDRFISERHGTQGEAWQRGAEFFVNKESGRFIRCINVDLSNGQTTAYFFDVTRPMRVAEKMLGG